MKFGNYLRHLRITLKVFCYGVFQWLLRHKDLVIYAFFGGLTTLVDWGISFALYAVEINPHAANVVAWTVAVLFAFVTNRTWVFHSKRKGFGAITGELIGFAGGRVLSLGVQELLFVLAVDWLGMSEYLVKIPVAVLVVIINYFLSKFLFTKKKDFPKESADERSSEVCVKGGAIMISNHRVQGEEREKDRETEL